jgi:hypothetical protein
LGKPLEVGDENPTDAQQMLRGFDTPKASLVLFRESPHLVQLESNINPLLAVAWQIHIIHIYNQVHTYGTLFVQRTVSILFGTYMGFVEISVFTIFVSV